MSGSSLKPPSSSFANRFRTWNSDGAGATKSKQHRPPGPYAGPVVALGRGKDNVVAVVAERGPQRRAFHFCDDALETPWRNQRPRLPFHRSRALRARRHRNGKLDVAV